MSTPSFHPVEGLTFRCLVAGPADAEPLVLVHSLGSDLHLWDDIAPAFATTHRVFRYDLRGHGLSDCGPGECSIDDLARDLLALLAPVSPRPATIVGISVGGLVALAAARRAPERVRRLVLCATAARLGTRESWSDRIAAVAAHGLEPLADAIVARWFSPDFAARSPALVRGWRNRLTRTPAAGYAAVCAALRDADLRHDLAAVRAPALVLAGEHDLAAPPAAGRELAAGLPHARFTLLPGTAHLPPLEQPAALTTEILAFLSSAP